jgi:hypothetical protein
MMDEKRIFIANLSKGLIGEAHSSLLGSLLVTGFEIAALSRADIPPDERQDFFLYADEFHHYATDSFVSILSEARKYRLSLTLAHQYLGQLSEQISTAVFGNVGTFLAFRVSEADAALLERQYGGSFTSASFTGLENYELCARLLSREPFLAKSLAPFDSKRRRRKIVIRHSRRKYCTRQKTVEDRIDRWLKKPNHNGKRNSPSFSANLDRSIFQCFGCGAKGNVLEFAALMEKIDPQDGAALREVAIKLQQRFCPELRSEAPKTKPPTVAKPKSAEKPEPESKLPVLVNAPLDFELQGLDASHPYLLGRGFTPETIQRFGLGYCSRGMLKNRVAIPLHDAAGALVGYAGRVVDDKTITEENPRYRFPGERKRDGKTFEFRKTRFLYNGFRIKAPVDDLIVVEGFTSVWWLDQNGLPNVVGTMGADCSERQAELIVSLVKPAGRVWIAPDGDAAGERHAQTLLSLIAPHRLVRWVKMADGKQPTDLSRDQLKTSFTP